MVDLVVYPERHGSTDDVAKVAESEPCCDVTTSFVAFGIASGDGAFDAPEESGADSTCNRADIHEPFAAESVIDIETSLRPSVCILELVEETRTYRI